MPQFVLMVGVLVSATSFYLLFKPTHLAGLLDRVFGSGWLFGAALLRLLLGAGLIASAHTVAFPQLVKAFGWLFVLGGLGLVAIPTPPLRRMADWFGTLSPFVTRLWLLLSLLFGLFFIYVYLA
jgi:hypothetical protein